MNNARQDEPPTDVLAAEEFVVPAPDPGLTPEELRLPSDLVGGEPRDVLVAEEFAMPAPDEARVRPPARRTRHRSLLRWVSSIAPAAVTACWLLRRRARRSR